jgi:hypothetical protein
MKEKDKASRKRYSGITWLLLMAAIVSALAIIASDQGKSALGNSGAGEIWWVSVPEVELAYLRISGEDRMSR